MTAEPDLLPLLPLGECSEDSVREWCRANVTHFTAAKGAEIEALRAEVARRIEAFADRAEQLEARAERLEEALRELRNHTSVNSDQIALIDAALEQEAGRHTSLGERLRALRQQAIDGGMELQSEADIVKGLGRENDNA